MDNYLRKSIQWYARGTCNKRTRNWKRRKKKEVEIRNATMITVKKNKKTIRQLIVSNLSEICVSSPLSPESVYGTSDEMTDKNSSVYESESEIYYAK